MIKIDSFCVVIVGQLLLWDMDNNSSKDANNNIIIIDKQIQRGFGVHIVRNLNCFATKQLQI